jgi:acetoin:2,6-dichlorophenolindophenol oxidoreductase subunit alpha
MTKEISKDVLLDIYKKMKVTREFEETVARYFAKGMIHGTCHLCIGEEGSAAGSVAALKEQDMMHGTHRGHGQAISYGMDEKLMMAEIFGKETGYCKGKGGSMHIADIKNGFLGANGIVGAGIPLSTGAALALKLQKKEDQIVLCFFGDGATNEGAFHESLNMAATWNLPILYVCVNNLYGMSTHIERCMGEPDIAKRAVAYGMPGKTIDGNNPVEIYNTIKEAREYVAKKGPMLIVEDTYRITGHSKSDANRYRTKEEIESWKERCPIKNLEKHLLDNKIATEKELEDIEKYAQKAIEAAVEFAESSPYPSVDTVADDVFV